MSGGDGDPWARVTGPGLAPEPGEDAPTFDAPWQARAFAVAVALTDEDDLPWDAFQSRLVAEIDAGDADGDDPNEVYYRQWLGALERLLVEEGLLEPGELAERAAAFEAGDRSAHEFVAGDPHAHADRLPEGHAEGSHHDHGDGHGHSHDGGHGHDGHSYDDGNDHDHGTADAHEHDR